MGDDNSSQLTPHCICDFENFHDFTGIQRNFRGIQIKFPGIPTKFNRIRRISQVFREISQVVGASVRIQPLHHILQTSSHPKIPNESRFVSKTWVTKSKGDIGPTRKAKVPPRSGIQSPFSVHIRVQIIVMLPDRVIHLSNHFAQAGSSQYGPRRQLTPRARRGGGVRACHASPQSHDHSPSHPYNAGTEHVGLSPTRQTFLAPSAKRREMFGESHEG